MADAPPPSSAYAYPPELERAAVDAARALAPRSTEGECLDRLAPATARLSDFFTVARPLAFPDYAADATLALAYALFYAPQSWVRTRIALLEALEPRPRPLGADGVVRVLDLGAGLGSAGLAAAQLLRARGLARRVRLTAVDRSAAALAALRASLGAARATFDGIELATHVGDLADARSLATVGGPFDLIVVSFAMNEAFEGIVDDDRPRAWLRAVAAHLVPSGVLLVIEPAMRAIATRLREVVRPIAAAGDLHVLAPDLAGRVALPHADPRFVDHEVRRWPIPASVRRLNRTLRRSLDELTFAFLALSPTPAPAYPDAPRRVRVTSPFARLKGRRAFTALDTADARPTFDLLERSVDDETRARLVATERGDHVEILEARALREPGWWRLAGAASLRVAWRPT